MTYNNVSGFDKLKSGLPNHDVNNIHYVTKNVTKYPVGVGSGVVVREGQSGRAKPNVVVVRHRYESQPGNIPTICRDKHTDFSISMHFSVYLACVDLTHL